MPFIALVIALILRLIYLYANTSLNLPPVWFSVVHSSLRAAEHFMEVPADQVQGGMGLTQAINHYLHEMRAGTWLHMADIYIFGHTSLLRLSVLGVFLDCLSLLLLHKTVGMALPGQPKQVAQRTAWFYALSPLHIFMSAVPSWYTWLNFGVIVLTYAVLYVLNSNSRRHAKKWYWPVLMGTGVILSFISQYRATVTMLPIFMAIVLSAIALYFKLIRTAAYEPYLRTALWVFNLGVFVNVSYGVSNRVITGEFFLGRKHIAHSFLMGLGEQKSEYSLEHDLDGTDNSVYNYYFNTHPGLSKNHEPTVTAFSDMAYRNWTRSEMVEFIRAHPLLYAKFYTLRVVKQLIPNFRFSLIADVDAYAKSEPIENRNLRLSLVKQQEPLNFEKIALLIKNSPVYCLDYILRILVMLLLPLSLLFGVNTLRKARLSSLHYAQLTIMLAPMTYMLVTLSLIRTPNFDHAAAWSVLLPICILSFVKKDLKFSQNQ